MQQPFAIPGRVRSLDSQGALPIVELSNDHGHAQLCLQGAQVIGYHPAGQSPALWLSTRSRFETGKAIRGGIPVCWPWFGDHPDNPNLPAHGFARTSLWQIQASKIKGQTTYILLALEDDDATRSRWPHAFRLELLVQLDHRLTLTLTTRNLSEIPMPITEALHSYLAVHEVTETSLSGLEGRRYRDKLDQLRSKSQDRALVIRGETDNVYLDTEATIELADPGKNRRLIVRKTNSRSTVIWNPWRDKAAAMSDFDNQGYREMLCVEAANALDNALLIPPGESHYISTSIESIPLDDSGLDRSGDNA